jgi:hypothetical protein
LISTIPVTESEVQVMVCCDPPAQDAPALGDVTVIEGVAAEAAPMKGTTAAAINIASMNAESIRVFESAVETILGSPAIEL